MTNKARLFLLTLLMFTAIPGFSDSSEVDFKGGWIKQLPPVVPMRAGYVTIDNDSKAALSIIGAESDAFASVEMHETVTVDGIMKMEQRASIDLPPQSTVVLKPGGAHLMLITPQRELAVGDKVNIQLTFSDDSSRNVEFEVRR